MRILIIFIDMVRVDHLHLYNPKTSVSLLDKRLEELGGTIFKKCYSPGPDTPRSLACMQSGFYPHYNGCDTRIKWPKFFMKEGISTIWDHAANKGWKVNLCCRKNECLTGFFKYEESSQINLFYDPDSFFTNGDFDDNSISFIGIPDMHTAINDYWATDFAIRKGNKIVDLYFDRYFTNYFLDKFDNVIIFSDHGLQMESESLNMKSSLDLLNDGRNKLLLLMHKKGDVGIEIDNRLASITDLYATLESLIGCSDFRQGYSLLESPKRTITHVEDHKEFTVYPEIMVKQWRIITNNFDVRTNIKDTIIDKGTEHELKDVESYLSEYSPSYFDYMKQLKVLDYYEELNREEKSHNYFIGVKRPSRAELFYTLFFLKNKYRLYLLRKKILGS